MPHSLVIGAGLSGLYAASLLHQRGHTVTVIEARDRVGGRILTIRNKTKDSQGAFDLGPAWIWPPHRRIQALLSDLGLSVFPQYSQGDLMVEFAGHNPVRRAPYPMHGSAMRINGGLGTVIDALMSRLNHTDLHLNSKVTSVEKLKSGLKVGFGQNGTKHKIDCDHMIVALPPRIAATFDWAPSLPNDMLSAMTAIPTWMAGHAKVIAVYDTPFWRHHGLSGDAISEIGPLAQIHDASPMGEPSGALFGFAGLSARERAAVGSKNLKSQAIDQLTRLFGPNAAEPSDVWVKDWSTDDTTATEADKAPLNHHPHYGPPAGQSQLWNGLAAFAGTEVAEEDGGYLEGALAAAESAVAHINLSKAS